MEPACGWALFKEKRMSKLRAVQTIEPTNRAPARPGTLFDPSFVYLKGADVANTWRRYGWVPPSEYRNDYEFKKNREGSAA